MSEANREKVCDEGVGIIAVVKEESRLVQKSKLARFSSPASLLPPSPCVNYPTSYPVDPKSAPLPHGQQLLVVVLANHCQDKRPCILNTALTDGRLEALLRMGRGKVLDNEIVAGAELPRNVSALLSPVDKHFAGVARLVEGHPVNALPDPNQRGVRNAKELGLGGKRLLAELEDSPPSPLTEKDGRVIILKFRH